MSVQIITYGAIIKQLLAPDRDGNFANILLTVGTIQQFQAGVPLKETTVFTFLAK